MELNKPSVPLIKKLGIKEDSRVWVINQPADYFQLLNKDISGQYCSKNETPDLVHLFVKSIAEMDTFMRLIKIKMKPTTVIWVSWYKKASGIKTDVTEDAIRSYALMNNLVDVKVCSVSAIWSGLKLVVPLAKR